MKKYCIYLFVLVGLIFTSITNVNAATTITQADFDAAKGGTPTNGVTYNSSRESYSLTTGEEYIIGDNISIGYDNIVTDNNIINLNGKTITNLPASYKYVLESNNKSLKLKGTGTIDGTVRAYEGSFTVDGNITFKSHVEVNATSIGGVTATINGGTFERGFKATNAILTINGGTFNEQNNLHLALGLTDCTTTIKGGTFTGISSSAAFVSSGTLTIEGGTFTSPTHSGLEASYNPNSNPAPTIIIKGGSFTGLNAGFTDSASSTILELHGGTFKATGTDAADGAIRINSTFTDLLEPGYKYSVDSTTTNGVYSAKEVSIIPITLTVTFKDGNKVLNSQIVKYGEYAVLPSEPTKDGYEFLYWSNVNGRSAYDWINADTVFTASWVRRFNIISGDDQTFYLKSDKDIVIETDGPKSELIHFGIFDNNFNLISMKDLTEGKDYVLEGKEHTKLILKNSFLKTLKTDIYYIELNYENHNTYEDGYAETYLTVKDGDEPITASNTKINNPKTTDNIMIYISMLGLSIIGLVGTSLCIAKKRLN